MPKISELISLPVYSINERKCIGHISNILLDTKQIKFYVIYNEDDESYSLLSPRSIYGTTNKAVTIKNMSAITLMQNEDKTLESLSNPINTLAISTKGEVCGTIQDIIVDGNKIAKYICDKEILPSDVLYSNDKITMLKSEQKEKISTFAIKTPHSIRDDRIVTIQNIAPLREIVGNSMLIGRKATQDITGLNGEIIIKANSTITAKVLNKIKYSGKLKELTMHSK